MIACCVTSRRFGWALFAETPEVRLDLGAPSREPPAGFVRLGVAHILSGYDHLLFLAALVLGGGSIVALLKTITAFTVAHSIARRRGWEGGISVPRPRDRALSAWDD